QASCQKYRGDKTAFSEYDSNYGGGGDGNIHEPQLVGTLMYISFYKMSLRGPPISIGGLGWVGKFYILNLTII
ncbi:MAG: hypothetical protein OD815_001978, partial [Candidatus Alkanophagales archaeon MCA70_species_2]|nr:hypothetical protein [Candidatus Alkanophaga liquidiphilum]